MNQKIIAIDNDNTQLQMFGDRFRQLRLDAEFDLHSVPVIGSTVAEIGAHCIEEVKRLIAAGECKAIFVDIVLLEGTEPQDQSGIEVASRLASEFPYIPIIAMTLQIKAYRLLTEVAFAPCFQGFLIKNFFFFDTSFVRQDFMNLISKAARNLKRLTEPRSGIAPEPRMLPRRTPDKQFILASDPSSRFQLSEIDTESLQALLEQMFPDGRGTVSPIRPGFSGAHLLKAIIKDHTQGISPSAPRAWAIKLAQDRNKIQSELEKLERVRSRVGADAYPQLLKDKMFSANGLFAIAFEFAEDTETFLGVIRSDIKSPSPASLTRDHLIPKLERLYGDPQRKETYVWRDFFELSPKVFYSVSNFAVSSEELVQRHLGAAGGDALQRIKRLADTSAETEAAVLGIREEVDTRYIHADLNCRNILVSPKLSKVLLIDFANSTQDHVMKDFAKLETDVLFLGMDSHPGDDWEWSHIAEWQAILAIYKRENIFRSNPPSSMALSTPVDQVGRVINEIRKGLRNIVQGEPDERQYLLALLHFGLKYLTYPDVTLPKKIFGISYLGEILAAISPDRYTRNARKSKKKETSVGH